MVRHLNVAGRRKTAAGLRACRSADGPTDPAVRVVAAVLVAGSEKAAAHRLGLSHSTVKHHLAKAQSKVGGDHDGAAGVDPWIGVASG